MSEDMSNLMNQINHMMKNNEIPDDIKNIINNITNNNQNSSETNSNKDVSSSDSSNESSSMPDFDITTIMKMKNLMDSMKSNRDDPRANLLKSLKPYLKNSRKEKVDQYIQIFGMGKVFEMLGPLGGDNHKWYIIDTPHTVIHHQEIKIWYTQIK